MTDPLLAMAFTTGLLGTGHCLGMCGSLVGALSLGATGQAGSWRFHLLYNAGRITTYTVIGGLVGWLGSALAYADRFRMLTRTLLAVSDLFVVLVGLGTAGLFSWLNASRLDFPGPLQAMTGAVQRLRGLPPTLAALPLGLLFGFLPCGYLYAVALSAAQSADPVLGAATMLAFGLGTAPALVLFGGAAQWLGSKARLWMLRVAGLLVAGMGMINLLRHLRMMGIL